MRITCPQCGTSGNLNDKLIPDEGRTVKCPKCKHGFFITRPAPPMGVDTADEGISPPPDAPAGPRPDPVTTFVGTLTDDLKGKSAPASPGPAMCPNCGSADIIWEKRGFDNQSAGCGCCLLGPFGLLFGLVGKDRPVRFCRNCAYRWDTANPSKNLSATPEPAPESAPAKALTPEQDKAKRKSTIIALSIAIPALVILLFISYCTGQ